MPTKGEDTEGGISNIPTILYFQISYGRNMEGNDKKALRVFSDFENHEKLRRLQNELSLVKDGKVKSSVCDQTIGKTRKEKYGSYSHWASLMLLWIAAHKK